MDRKFVSTPREPRLFAFALVLSVAGLAASARAEPAKLVPLHAWWAPGTQDNRTTSDPAWVGLPGETRAGGYSFHRVMGWVYSPDLPKPTGTSALYAWFSDARGDHLLSSQPYWAATTPGTVRDGYRFLRLEGYLRDESGGGATVGLHSWWSASRGDNYATTMPDWSGASGDSREGYARYRPEGYVFPPESRSELKRFSQNDGLPRLPDDNSFFRNQQQSMHCQTFAATAALEAAYKRKYGGNWDLSEEFLGYMGKLNWLNADAGLAIEIAQNQIGLYGGGGGSGMLKLLRDGIRIPKESAEMPYIPMWTQDLTDEWGRRSIVGDSEGDESYMLDVAGNRVDYASQEFVNALNFGPVKIDSEPFKVRFPQTMLGKSEYYGASDIEILCQSHNARIDACPGNIDASDVETVIRSGHELIYDIYGGKHVRLIVGYDRTDPDPTKHFFLVKDSYGGRDGEDGFLREPYEVVLRTTELSYIVSVLQPGPWQQLRGYGRWNVVFDGHRGELVVHRNPGIYNEVFADGGIAGGEMRIGTFKDSANKMFRANGSFGASRVQFYVDAANPVLGFTALTGRNFAYYLSGRDALLMAGFHRNPEGSVSAGYATKGRTFSGRGSTFHGPQRWIGVWDASIDGRTDMIDIRSASSTAVIGTYRSGSTTTTISGTIDSIGRLNIPLPSAVTLSLKELNHQPGVAAGYAASADASDIKGIVLTRR